MINKQNIWFLTLFSLILVLCVYYLTMSNDVLEELITNKKTESVSEIYESDALAALEVEKDEAMVQEMNALQEVLLDENKTVEEKNTAYETLKELNLNKGKEETLVKLIQEKHNLKSFVKIKGNQISIVVAAKEHNETLANSIIKTVQSQYKNQMYITVKFQS